MLPVTLVVCAIPLRYVGNTAENVPEPLFRMETARRTLLSIDVVWTIAEATGPRAGRTLRYRNRCRGESEILERLQNDEGVVEYDRTGAPRLGSEQRYLRNPQYSAEFLGRFPECRVYPAGVGDEMQLASMRRMHDIRALGLCPDFNGTRRLDNALRGFPDPDTRRTYTTEKRGDLHVVTARLASGEAIVWEINPNKGWNAERIQFLNEGRLELDAQVTLEQFDGVWFPASVELFRGPPGREPVYTVRVEQARFDPNPPNRPLGLEDMALEVGTQILTAQKVGDPERRVWDGRAALEVEAFREKRRAGRITLGPTVQAYAEDAAPPHPEERFYWQKRLSQDAVTQRPSDWERYVQGFVGRHGLTDEQTQKAVAILADCQQRAHAQIDANRAEFERIEQRFAASESINELRRSGELDELNARMERLTAPIDRIFERELKPRLDGLLTRAQRAAASAPTSSPRPAADGRP
ncbi:MAG: hypothetical protein HRF50_16850 [Phycisphaerae bacterium]|jgi:hypothetical protein